MAKKKGVKYWHKKTWSVFSRYIRMRDYDEHIRRHPEGAGWFLPCISCGKEYPLKKLQGGHFISAQKTEIKYDEKNVHAQCYNCNINLKGNWAGYLETMEERYGKPEVTRLMESRHTSRKFDPIELEGLYDSYIVKLNKLTHIHGSPWEEI